jgi:DNA-binding winged helix-turn-helix (wHTH) protein
VDALLQSPHGFLSWGDLYAAVYPDTIVEPQMLYYHIHHLRRLFGRNAFETLARRGVRIQ